MSFLDRRRAMALCAAMTIAAHAGLPRPSFAQTPSFGSVTGRVDAVDTRRPLVGARVSIDNTALVVSTENGGRFLFPRVAAGIHTLRVTYIGRSASSRQITVVADRNVTADVSLSTVTLSRVTVHAAGQAAALSRQRSADNIQSVVSSDQMGRFPDASAPEAVQRLPGVSLQRDQGEGRYIQLRGSSAATTQVRINGEEIGSPESDSRQIALDAIPVGVLGTVEVHKAITPDMDADAVGGSVNLITRQPVGRTFSFETSGGYAPLREKGSGQGALTLGDRVANDRLGYLLSGSFGERNFGSDDIEPDYDGDELDEVAVRHYTLWRRRSGASAAFDFQATDRSKLTLNGMWSELQDQEQRRAYNESVGDNEIEYDHKNRLEKLSTFNVLVGGEHLLGRGITVREKLGYTRSQEDTPFDRNVTFLREDVEFNPTRANPEAPQTNPVGGMAGQYVFDEYGTGGTLTRNRDWVGGLDFGVPFAFGSQGQGTFEFGGKFRDKRKNMRVDQFSLEHADDTDDIVLGGGFGTPFTNRHFVPGNYAMPFWTDADAVKNFASTFAGALTSPEADVESQAEAFELTERVWAGYAALHLDITPGLMLLPGVRVEGTTLTSHGNAFDDESEALIPQVGTNSYTNIFPMAHLRYRLSEETNLRAAYTSTIFRPNFFDLVPYEIRDAEDREMGNPGLEPMRAQNFDLMLERFDRTVGLISAGAFFKRLDKPIFSYTFDNELGGETTQPVNATDGRILGFELALQKRLTFLPGALDGLGVYANYTYTDSKATQPNGRETRLAGQSDQTYNLALSYEKRRFSGQVSVNRIGGYISELGEAPEDDLFASARTQIDLSASYFVRPSTQLFLDALNLGNEPFRTYQGASDRVRQLEFYRPSLQVGVRVHP